MSDTMRGYCGYNCGKCAGRSEDKELRRKMVDGWKRIFGHTMYTEDNMPILSPCPGCKSDGEVADKICEARPCAKEKGVEFCADCDEFICKKVGGLMGDESGLLVYCFRKPELTQEDYELCAKQFASMPFVAKRLVENGRSPKWIKEYLEKKDKNDEK